MRAQATIFYTVVREFRQLTNCNDSVTLVRQGGTWKNWTTYRLLIGDDLRYWVLKLVYWRKCRMEKRIGRGNFARKNLLDGEMFDEEVDPIPILPTRGFCY